MNQNDMHTRAMLANLSISAWSARKYDRKVTAEANAAQGASSDAGRYNKSLLPGDAGSYKALAQFIANLRVVHYAQSLPWSDTGWRLLPVKNYTVYSDLMRKSQHEFNSLLDSFVVEYPTLREGARLALNGMFNADDYPVNVRSKYDFNVEYSPVPVGTDFRITLAQTEIDIIAKRTEERVKQAFDNAQSDAVNRLRDCLSRIHERLAQPDAIFRDSLITNARDLCDVLTRLNVTDDPALEGLRRQTELLASTSPDVLRTLPDVRQDTANRAQSILDAMTATFGRGGN